MISVKVENGKTFCIHKNVLIQDSAYFRKALDGPFSESRTNSIDLDDIPGEHFGLYVSVIYPLAFERIDFTLQDVWRHPKGFFTYSILTLWRLGDRFLNDKVTTLAEKELNTQLVEFSIDAWKRMYERRSEATLRWKARELQRGFQACEEYGLPFKEKFVTAASNAPPQAFAKLVDDMQGLFGSEVTRAFALRFSDDGLIPRKRRLEENREREQQEKRVKIEE